MMLLATLSYLVTVVRTLSNTLNKWKKGLNKMKVNVAVMLLKGTVSHWWSNRA